MPRSLPHLPFLSILPCAWRTTKSQSDRSIYFTFRYRYCGFPLAPYRGIGVTRNKNLQKLLREKPCNKLILYEDKCFQGSRQWHLSICACESHLVPYPVTWDHQTLYSDSVSTEQWKSKGKYWMYKYFKCVHCHINMILFLFRILKKFICFWKSTEWLFNLVAHEIKKWKLLVTWSCLTLCDPMDCRPSGSSVHGIL